jgi:hypothetical protein
MFYSRFVAKGAPLSMGHLPFCAILEQGSGTSLAQPAKKKKEKKAQK